MCGRSLCGNREVSRPTEDVTALVRGGKATAVAADTASLRAKATFAFRMPARFATANAHFFRAEPLTGRVSITFTAS